MNPDEILTVNKFVEFSQQFNQRLMERIAELEKQVSLLTNSGQKMNRLRASKYLGLTYSQMATISYDKATELPHEKKRVPFIRVGGSILYDMEDLKKEKERFMKQLI